MERKTDKPTMYRVREIRENLGVTQTELANLLGISNSQLSRIESGKSRLNAEKLMAIARHLNVSTEQILGAQAVKSLRNAAAHGLIEVGHNLDKTPLNYGGRDFPIYGSGRAGEDGVLVDHENPIAFTHTPPELVGVKGGYGLNVISDSMEPFVRNGDHVHVNPHIPPRPGSFVVVHFTDGSAIIKQLVKKTSDRLILEQLNPPKTIEVEIERVANIHWVSGTALLR